MTDKYADLRAALDADPAGDKWMCVKYSPKTLGVGISGGPALFMAREGSCTDIDDVRDIVGNLLTVRNQTRALLADYDRMRDAVQETIRVIESNPSSISDTVWVTGNMPETLLDRCRAALAQEQP